MKAIFHNARQFTTRPVFGNYGSGTPAKCLGGNIIYEPYFVAALVFIAATVDRNANTTYSLFQFNPVTARNSICFNVSRIVDTYLKPVKGIARRIHLFNASTVAFLFSIVKTNAVKFAWLQKIGFLPHRTRKV